MFILRMIIITMDQTNAEETANETPRAVSIADLSGISIDSKLNELLVLLPFADLISDTPDVWGENHRKTNEGLHNKKTPIF